MSLPATTQNPLKVMEQQIATAKSVKDLLKIDVLVNRYISSYEAATGRKDGVERFERESFAFMDIINSGKDLEQCDRISQFAGFLKGAMTGLSFSSGKLSVYYRSVKVGDDWKKYLVVEPDAHGKKEILGRMPTIKKVDEGVVVFTTDEFGYDPISKMVKIHTQKFPLPKASKDTVMAAYCSVHFTDGHREDVVITIDEIEAARAHSTNVSYHGQEKVKDGGQLWTQHYGEACKKTTYNRTYKVLNVEPDTPVMFKRFEIKEEVQDIPHKEVVERGAGDDYPVIDQSPAEEPVKKPKKKETNEESFV